jgi:hypothetical protein
MSSNNPVLMEQKLWQHGFEIVQDEHYWAEIWIQTGIYSTTQVQRRTKCKTLLTAPLKNGTCSHELNPQLYGYRQHRQLQ